MQVYASRDSVCAGDDSDAPHGQRFSFPDTYSVMDVVAAIVKSHYLASISGGHATWSAVSGFPIAVIAQQLPEPLQISWRPIDLAECEHKSGVLQLHFNYHLQKDPDDVLKVLRELKLHAR